MEEDGSDLMDGGQYPTGQLCQTSHLEMRGEMQMVHGPAREHVEAALWGWALTLLAWAFLLPAPFLGWCWGFLASLGWSQTPGFVILPLTHYC